MDSTNMREQILLQGRSALKTLESSRERVIEVAAPAEFDRIIINGAGDKYLIGLVAQYLWRKYGREPLQVIHSRDLADNPPYMDEGTLAIFLSQSGRTKDTVDAARLALKRGAQAIVITNLRERKGLWFVERHGGTVLNTLTELYPERAMPSTMTFHSTLSLLWNLLAELAGRDLYGELVEEARRVDELSRSPQVERDARKLASRLRGTRYVFGDGPRYGLARKLALIMTMEGVKEDAFALESEEFLHSAIETLEGENEEKLPLLIFMPPRGEPFRRTAEKIHAVWSEYAPSYRLEPFSSGLLSVQSQMVLPTWLAYHEALMHGADPGVGNMVKKVRAGGF